MKLKVCGMRDHKNIEQVVQLNPDYLGFIFYPKSARYIGENYQMPANIIPHHIKKTGVFVNENIEKIKELSKKHHLDAIQLHGNESVDDCINLLEQNLEVIKAFPVDENFNFSVLSDYVSAVNHFLFDTKSRNHGGSGKKFNWDLLKKNKISKTFFLSGGIDLPDTAKIMNLGLDKLYAIDINSRFESAPAIKDVEKIKKLKLKINEIK